MSTMLRCLALFLFFVVTPAFAQLSQYGYVVGTLNPSKSFLEKLDEPDKGKYLHYHIFLTTAASEQYEVVIDVNDVSPTKPLIYRIASLDNQYSSELLAANFGPVFGATSTFHLISNTDPGYGPVLTPNDADKKAAGALDYVRHPGLLKATRNLPWQNMYAQTTSDPLQWSLPKLDALFKPCSSIYCIPTSTKVTVFGAPFTYGGKGMHVVHLNQSDTVASHAATNATWQDGAVIIERTSILLGGGRTTRSVLMTKFAAQNDFSVESNDVTKPGLAGHTVAPTTQTFAMGLICGDWQTYGPFTATQLEVATESPYAEPYGPGSAPKIEVRVKNGAFTSYDDPGDYLLVDQSTDASAAGRAFGRSYSPLSVFWFNSGGIWKSFNIRSSYYVRVHAIDPNSYCDSAVGGTLRVSKY